jgi:hypothetical protein
MAAGVVPGKFKAMTTNEIEVAGDGREQALTRLKKRRDFQGHLVAYVVVNLALWAVWAATGAGYPWPAWVTGGWAIGLLLNAWEVYFRTPITEAEVRREMDRARSQD